MRYQALVLLLACLLMGGCGAATAHAATAPAGGAAGKSVLACSVRFNGVGLDFVKYHLTCSVHDANTGDTAYTLTGQAQTERGPFLHFTWCRGTLAHGAATCQGDFVVIVPIHAQSLTVTAHFLPGNGTAQTQAAIPQG